MNWEKPDFTAVLPELGTMGLILIVLEGTLELKLTKSKSKIIKKPLPADDPVRRQPDITLAKQKLSWEHQGPRPSTSLAK